LNSLADQWEQSVGPLVRHGNYAFLASAIYSIQVEGEEVSLYFRDHSVSFAFPISEQALEVLAELSRRWQAAVGEVPAT
jgi:hypothetical protein